MSLFRRNNRIRQQLRGIFGAAAEGIGTGIESARTMQDRQRQRDLQERRVSTAERELDLQETEARRERQQQQRFQRTLSQIVDGPQGESPQGQQGPQQVPGDERTVAADQRQRRAQGLRVIEQFAGLSKTPRSVRGPQVDTLAAQFKKRTGRDMASNVVETLKRGSEKDLTQVSRGLAKMATDDESFDVKKAVDILSDPGKSAAIFTQAGKMAPVLEEQDETEQQAGQTPSEGGTQSAPSTGGQPGPTRERAAAQGQEGQATEAAAAEGQAGTLQEVSRLNQTVGRLRRLRGVQGLTNEQQSQVEFQIEQRERRRNEILERTEGNLLRATRNMPDDQALRRLEDFESTLLESNAPQEQINRVQDRIGELQPDEEDQGRLSFTPTFQRVAAGLYGPDTVTTEQGEFDGARLSREQISEVNQRIEDMGLEKERASALADRRSEANTVARKRADELFSTQALIGELSGSPEGAVGVRRALANLTGSTVGQVPGLSGAANTLTEFFTGGLDQQQLSALNTQFRSIVGKVANTFVGDGGGRLSNQDLQRVDRAIPAQETFATKDQVMGSLKELASLQELALWKQKFRAGNELDFNPNESESVEAKAREYMRRFDMDGQQAVSLVRDVATLGDVHGGM